MTKTQQEFQQLVEIIARLRGPDGCPWDKQQSQKSLTQYIVEEAYELVEALEQGTQAEICDELGDFLFQVVLQQLSHGGGRSAYDESPACTHAHWRRLQ